MAATTTPVTKRFEELNKQARELREQGHAVVVYSTWSSENELESVSMTHYLTCVACQKAGAAQDLDYTKGGKTSSPAA